MLGLFRKTLFNRSRTAPAKILVFRTGSLGDSVCATPALEVIRRSYPQAHITLLSNTGKKSFVSPDKVIHKTLYNDIVDYLGIGPLPLLRSLRQQKFDMVIQLPQVDAPFYRLLRDLLYFRMVAPRGWGWQMSRVTMFRKTIEKYIFYPNEAQRLLRLCSKNGLNDNALEFKLHFEAGDEQAVDKFFSTNHLQGKAAIAVAVGANSIKNRWPIAYFTEVINHFRLTNPVLLIGGPEDNELIRPMDGLEGVYNCCGKFTPMQSALLIKRCALSVTNDTGPLHLSYAVGTPLIGLFASRDFYGKWFPPENSKHTIFRTPDVACSLCFFNACDNNICMKAIQPAEVIAAAEAMMAL